jgi:hypothetical protein
MVGIAQLVERLVVVQDVAGSSPVTHPKKKPEVIDLGFLTFKNYWFALSRTSSLTRAASA